MHLKACLSRPLLALLLMLGGAITHGAELPATVRGIVLTGSKTHSVSVRVRDAKGQPRIEAEPAIAVIHNSRWNPADPVRDGAREFEIYLTAASLLRDHNLAGIVGVGNKLGRLMPDAEQALKRSALMGIPVAKVAANGFVEVDADNLLIEAGSLSETDTTRLLSQCILCFGALPPCSDPSKPTTSELAAIHVQLNRYQAAFSAAEKTTQVASR